VRSYCSGQYDSDGIDNCDARPAIVSATDAAVRNSIPCCLIRIVLTIKQVLIQLNNSGDKERHKLTNTFV
jgi:hypothetical protein